MFLFLLIMMIQDEIFLLSSDFCFMEEFISITLEEVQILYIFLTILFDIKLFLQSYLYLYVTALFCVHIYLHIYISVLLDSINSR